MECSVITKPYDRTKQNSSHKNEGFWKEVEGLENNLKFSAFPPNVKQLEDEYSLQVFKAINQANKSADHFDGINAESDQLFNIALEISRKEKREDLEIYSSINYAFYLYKYRKYRDCFPYFMYCMNRLQKMETNEVIEPFDTYKKLAYFLTTANENDLAILFYRKAEKIPNLELCDRAILKDGLGNVFLNKNELVSAEKNFQLAFSLAQQCGDHLRQAKALGNLAEIHFRKNNFPVAVNFLKKDIAFSETNGNDQNSMFALIKLCKVYLKMNLPDEAKRAVLKAEKYANSKSYFQSSLYEINEYKLQIAKRENNTSEELSARRKLENLHESLKNLDGKDVVIAVNWNLEKLRLQNKVSLEQKKLEAEAMRRNSAVIVSILLTIVMLLIIHSNKIKRKARREQYDNNILQLTLDKLQSENKLNATSKTISSYKNFLFEKNNQIKDLEVEMKKIQSLPGNQKVAYESKLEDLLKSHLMTLENWNQFKSAYRAEKPEYATYLDQNFPELTDANLRVIYLTQLDLSNAEIARILGVTIAAVKKAKQRLRIKYEEAYEKLFMINSDLEFSPSKE